MISAVLEPRSLSVGGCELSSVVRLVRVSGIFRRAGVRQGHAAELQRSQQLGLDPKDLPAPRSDVLLCYYCYYYYFLYLVYLSVFNLTYLYVHIYLILFILYIFILFYFGCGAPDHHAGSPSSGGSLHHKLGGCLASSTQDSGLTPIMCGSRFSS